MSAQLLNEKISAAVNQQYDPMMDLLTFVHQEKIRRPDLVLSHGQVVLTKYPGRLADRIWSVYEQVLLAALDAQDHTLASSCLAKLKSKFSSTSLRVRRLEGMIYESQEKYTQAREIYADILNDNPANMLVMKREIAISRAHGNISEAISKCNDLLARFPVDPSGWQELAELYCLVGKYTSAAFCFEELILYHPLDAVYHLKLAEMYVTVGSIEHLRLARKHYCQSLELQRLGNVRALVGLWACTRAFSNLVKNLPEERALNDRLASVSLSKIQLTYATEASTDLAALTQKVWTTEASLLA